MIAENPAKTLTDPSLSLEEFEQLAAPLIHGRPLLSWQSVGRFLDAEPGPVNWLFRDLIEGGIVGAVVARGGTGKSFLLNQLAAAAATGRAFGPFVPEKPSRVLLLAGEDPESILHRRIRATVHGMGLLSGPQASANDAFLRENFAAVSLLGESRVLIAKGATGNPETTAVFAWLSASLENLGKAGKPVDLLLIDPLSRFFGLNENDNADATAWISALEALAKKHGLTVIFAHHVAKGAGKDGSDLSGRGASAIGDGCRFVLSLNDIDPKDLKTYGIPYEDRYRFVCMRTPKFNYVPRSGKDVFFRRGEGGILEPFQIDAGIRTRQAEKLVGIMVEEGKPATQRDLLKGSAWKAARQEMKEEFPTLPLRADLPLILTCAVENGLLERKESTEKNLNGLPTYVYRFPGATADTADKRRKNDGQDTLSAVEPDFLNQPGEPISTADTADNAIKAGRSRRTNGGKKTLSALKQAPEAKTERRTISGGQTALSGSSVSALKPASRKGL